MVENELIKEDVMGYNKRGRMDGTGSYKHSYQRKKYGKKGRRQQKGLPCPKNQKF